MTSRIVTRRECTIVHSSKMIGRNARVVMPSRPLLAWAMEEKWVRCRGARFNVGLQYVESRLRPPMGTTLVNWINGQGEIRLTIDSGDDRRQLMRGSATFFVGKVPLSSRHGRIITGVAKKTLCRGDVAVVWRRNTRRLATELKSCIKGQVLFFS